MAKSPGARGTTHPVQLADVGRCLVALAAAAFLLAGAGHPAGTLIVDHLIQGSLAPVVVILRPSDPGTPLQSMMLRVTPLLDTATERVWRALCPLLGLLAAFALLGVPVIEENRGKAILRRPTEATLQSVVLTLPMDREGVTVSVVLTATSTAVPRGGSRLKVKVCTPSRRS